MEEVDRRFEQATFAKSCYHYQDLPEDEGWEVVFLGRSNVGKSSLINALCRRRGLAKASKTPGRTQCFNVFTLSKQARFVDAPGYGFAKVQQKMMHDWQSVLKRYVVNRSCLRMIVLLMDARYPLQENDRQWLDYFLGAEVPLTLVLSKMDKLSGQQQRQSIQKVRQYLQLHQSQAPIWGVSSSKQININELRQYLQGLEVV